MTNPLRRSPGQKIMLNYLQVLRRQKCYNLRNQIDYWMNEYRRTHSLYAGDIYLRLADRAAHKLAKIEGFYDR